MTFKQSIVRHTPSQFIHWGKWLFDSRYRRKSRHLARIESVPRYQPTVTGIFGKPLELIDSSSFIGMYREIFEREIYRFQSNKDRPYIVDCGANIGLSVLYFKQLYPNSRIVAFEPDEMIFAVLMRNLKSQDCEEVELHCRAVWDSETTLSFVGEGADAGRLSRNGEPGNKVVRTARLRDYLNTRVSFLKIDIEGAETRVLQDCADLLGNVDNLFVEYHSFADEPQTLHSLLGILANAGFRVHVLPENISPRPFVERNIQAKMDMQLNVFAFRPAGNAELENQKP